MASYEKRIEAEDDAAVNAYREKFGDEKAAEFAADLYKLRRTRPPEPPSPAFYGFPRFVIVLIALWVALLETAEKLPRLLLAVPGYEATLAELHAKMMQPDIVAAQLEKAKNEAKASAFQPDLTAVQLDKNRNEAKASIFQPNLAAVQLEKSTYEAAATAYAPAKANFEARAARWQPALIAAQSYEAQMKWLSGVPNEEWQKSGNISIASEHPLPPDLDPLLPASKPVMPKIPSAAEVNANSPVDTAKTEVMHAIAKDMGAPETPKPKVAEVETPPPPSPAQQLRKPVAFDCAKRHLGVDYVVCASPQLLDAMARLEDAYGSARASKGDAVQIQEIEWSKHYGPDCGLPAVGRPTDSLIQGTSYCVGRAIEARIKELQAMR